MNMPPIFAAGVDHGWLRAMDAAFAQLLVDLGNEQDECVLAAAALVSRLVASGNVCLDLQALLQTPEALFADAVSRMSAEAKASWLILIGELQQVGLDTLCRRLDASSAVGNGAGAEPLVREGRLLYLRRYWQCEKQVAEGLRARIDEPLPAFDVARLRQRLDALYADSTDDPDWQKIATAVAAQQRFTVVSGGPGTGKTTTVVRVLGLLQDLAVASSGQPLRIVLAAPTGKASARLTESITASVKSLPNAEHIPTRVSTLHKLLGLRPDTREFRYHRANPLPCDILVIDEASMIDLEMMAAVVDALSPKARLIMLGDKDQLASVEAGAILGEICRDAHLVRYSPALLALLANAGLTLRPDPDVMPQVPHPQATALDDHVVVLKRSRRFDPNGGIGKLARLINAGGHEAEIMALLTQGDVQARMRVGDSVTALLGQDVLDAERGYAACLALVQEGPRDGENTAAWAKRVLEKMGAFQVLCAVRQGDYGVERINTLIAEMLCREGLIGQTEGWYAGRPVMVTQNDYALGLMNGDIGMTLPDPEADGKLRVFFAQTEGIKRVLPSRLVQVETVFAMTVHKSQGSEFEHTLLVLPDAPSPILTRELVYTAVTRARHRFTLVLKDKNVMVKALGAQVLRCSGLAGRLGFLIHKL